MSEAMTQIRNLDQVNLGAVEENTGKTTSEYSDVLASRRNVLVKVPRENPNSSFVAGHYFRGRYISPHFEGRSNVNRGNVNKGLVQRNIFNFCHEDEGKWRVADVEVRKKTTPRGCEVLLLDITLQGLPREEAEFKLKFRDKPEVQVTPHIGVSFEKL